jgi:hypothetical protein
MWLIKLLWLKIPLIFNLPFRLDYSSTVIAPILVDSDRLLNNFWRLLLDDDSFFMLQCSLKRNKSACFREVCTFGHINANLCRFLLSNLFKVSLFLHFFRMSEPSSLSFFRVQTDRMILFMSNVFMNQITGELAFSFTVDDLCLICEKLVYRQGTNFVSGIGA